MRVELSDRQRCLLLTMVHSGPAYGLENEPLIAILSQGRPWAPYRSLRDWQADQPPD
jgi:hypothetical protein